MPLTILNVAYPLPAVEPHVVDGRVSLIAIPLAIPGGVAARRDIFQPRVESPDSAPSVA